MPRAASSPEVQIPPAMLWPLGHEERQLQCAGLRADDYA